MENDYGTKACVERTPSQVERGLDECSMACERLAKVVNELEQKLEPVMVGPYPTDTPGPSKDCEEMTPVASHLVKTADNINHLVGCISTLIERTKL